MAAPGVVDLRSQTTMPGASRAASHRDLVTQMQGYLAREGMLGVKEPEGPTSTPVGHEPARTDTAAHEIPIDGEAQRDANGQFTKPTPPSHTTDGEEPSPTVAAPVTAVVDDPSGYARTLADLAGYFEVEPEQLTDTIEIEGHDGQPVSLTSVIAGYKEQPQAARYATERAGLEEHFRAQGAEQQTAHDAAIMENLKLSAILNERLGSALPSEERLRQLQVEDPSGYKQVMLNYYEGKDALTQAQAKIQDQMDSRTQKRETDHTAWLQREQAKCLEIFPELKDKETSRKVGLELRDFLSGVGLTDKDMSQLEDHRYLVLARMAFEGSKMKTKGREAIEQARERGLPIPKQRPSQRNPQRNATDDANQEFNELVGAMKNLSGTAQRRDNLKLAEQAMLVEMSNGRSQ